MVNFLDTQSDARRFAALLADYDRRLQALERSTQAAHTSIEGGTMDIYDTGGTLKGSVGVQPDGGVALVPVNTVPPPTPTPPTVQPVLAGLLVGWDGQWDDSYQTPTDFSLIQVHVGPAPDFTPNVSTQVATITAPLGGTATIAIEGYAPAWVRLVGQNTAAVIGRPSTAVQGLPRQAVSQDLIDGIVTEVKLAQNAVTQAKIALGAVGSAALAAGAVLEDKLAKAAVTVGKIADGAVTLNALGGALSDSAAQRYVDAMGDPAAWQTLSKGTGAVWSHLTGVATAPTGQTVGQAQGFVQLRGTTLVPYEPGTLYRISARVRLTAPAGGSDSFYVGVLGIGADKATLVNRNGANSPNAHYYAAASSMPLATADGWVTVVGYLKDRAAAGANGSAGPNNDPRSAGTVHADVRFITPYLWLNYNGLDGSPNASVMQVDMVTIEALKTGLVDSTNLVAGSVTTAALATDAVTAGKVAADAISARELQAGSVTATELTAGAVTANAVAAGAITADKILAGAITTEKLVALAVTAEKVASLAITTDKLDALAVTADKLAVNSVTATKIEAGAVTASHIKAGAITADKLSLGTDGNLIADPSFEGAVTDQRLLDQTWWTTITPGNSTPRAVQVNAAATTATTRTHTLALAPAVPGQKMFLATDYFASSDWAGTRVSIYARWEDAAGGTLGFSTVTTGDSKLTRGSWQRIQGVAPDAAPANTVRVRIMLSTVDSTAGTVAYDNAEARPVLSSGPAGGRAELSPLGLLLYDGDGQESVSLVTGRPNYVTLQADGVAVATIDQHGNAAFQDLAVAGKLTVGGDPISALLDAGPRGIVASARMTSTVTTSGSELGFVELAFTADPTRMYRVVLDTYADASVAGGELQLFLRDGGNGAPRITSPQIQSAIHQLTTADWMRVRLETIRSGSDFGAGPHRLLVTFVNSFGPSGQSVSLKSGSTYPAFMYVEDVGPTIPETGVYSTGGGTSAPPQQKYVRTYDASWSGSYANRNAYNSYYGNKALQGYYSSTNGIQAALIGFPSSVPSDLSGATLLKAEAFVYFEHWYDNAGGRAIIKTHGHNSRPSTFSCDSKSISVSFARNEGKWVDITSIFDPGWFRGIALDPNSSSPAYYGIARGYDATNHPQLRLTFTR
ncbi:hypothetical protein [Streptomyces griseocarneus]|uniref:hypothetical protein n=1 Tax=Streptomyces griseocarneus TaxID=51201 RepID=UPI00167C7ED6|nr:hypothetical protein [Streptomyces griseocarneus]MBZ6476653.1 hypothetical protein [Streptomyces griseocarneus]GHG80148.1 hypothetical protein GCM10018779_61460 [Streptomyces griseocarneus]